jgi:hypothetical protein
MPYTIADENTPQSSHSPGIVELAEILLRLGFDPEHMKDGSIGPAAVSLNDLKERGFSVDRQVFIKRRVIENRARDQMAKMPAKRQEALMSSFTCGDVRALEDGDNNRAFIVVDTAEPHNDAHASIYSAYPRSNGQLRKIRSLLLPLLQSYVLLETYLQNHPLP